MPKDLQRAFRGDEPVIGTWVTLAPPIAELFAAQGFDFVVVDEEHSSMLIDDLANALRGIDAVDEEVASVVRLAGHDPDRIKRILDLGPDAIMAPTIDTPTQAEALVEACRYPPRGRRGVGPGRGADYGGSLAEVIAADDDAFAVIAQIESPAAVENTAAIADVDGVDALFVGPTDLSVAMEVDGDDDALVEAVDDVLGAVGDTPVGTFAVGEDAIERWGSRAFDFMAVGYDGDFLLAGSDRARKTFESAVSE